MNKTVGAFTLLALIGAVLATTTASVGAQLLCGGEPVTIMGTPDDDVITGTTGNDVIFAAQGDDWINARGGDDIVCAGQGDDTVMGGDGFDILYGAQGDDRLFSAAFGTNGSNREDTRGARMFGGAGNDILEGSDRWDRMQGGPGVDELNGYEGQDWLRGGPDRDFVNGGAGTDDLHGGNGSDRITVTNGDSVRGGNGQDMCVMGGPADFFVSCGRNQFEPGIPTTVIPGGTYAVPREVGFGYWQTTTFFSLDSADNRIVTNDFAFDNGPTIAIVDNRGATVEMRGSSRRVESAPRINPFAYINGRALVGYDLPPGQYRVHPTERFQTASIIGLDGYGNHIDIEIGSTSQILNVTPEMVFIDWTGRLERVD